MKKRIDQLLNGKFEYQTETLLLSEQEIAQEADPGETVTGQFTVSTQSERKIRSFVYASHPRVSVEPAEFYGKKARILYQADLTGLSAGDVLSGTFTLCSELGEVSLPYQIHVRDEEEKPYEGDLPRDAEALSALAEQDFSHAAGIYAQDAFADLLSKGRPDQAFLRRALGAEDAKQSLEEFLIGTGKKQPVSLSMETQTARLPFPERSVKQTTQIRTSGWGYLKLEITSDASFLRPEKKHVTTEEFVGGQFELEYIIDRNFLHGGRNYGRVCVSTCYQKLYLEVTVEGGAARESAGSSHVQKLMQRKLLELYLDLRLRRIDTQHWIDRSMNVLGSYKRAGGEDVFADLLQVQLYFADGKRMKAQHLLESLEREPRRFQTQDQYAFYLYLTTFFQKDSAYVDQVESRIGQMFLQQKTSWIMQWILLYLQEDYIQNDQARLEAIFRQMNLGCSSPILYVEALQYYNKNPYLLRALDPGALRVLLFGAKRSAIGEELAFQIANLAEHENVYDRKRLSILASCYEIWQSRELCNAICSILIAGKQKRPEDFSWYALGVHYDLRINGLYEYYMETMDTAGIEKMPQIIRMYFSYNTTLDYHKKAAVFRSISDNRESVPQVYRQNRSSIDHFLTEQLTLGRIDKNLAVLYERFLTRGMLTHALAERLAGVLFSFEITCKNPNMKSVVVVHPQRREEKETLLRGGKAIVRIYTSDARILLVDTEGRRYASTSLYLAERFLDSPLLTSYCRDLAPDHPGLSLYLCSTAGQVTRGNAAIFRQECERPGLTDACRSARRAQVLTYYSENPQEDELYTWLKEIRPADYVAAGKALLARLYAQRGMYEEAFSIVRTFGSEGIDLELLVRICSQAILLREYEEDRLLLGYCAQCLQYGKYDDNIISYLLMYFDGPVEEMKRLWNIGHSYEADTMVLEEKILGLVLFMREGSQGTEQIFASYQHKLGKKKIIRAYVILKSYEYFIKNLPVADLIFGYLEQNLRKGADLEEVCLLALLQYYSGMETLDEKRQESIKRLLASFGNRGMRFAFYQKFPRELRLPLQMEDRTFVEYVADPSHTVYLTWQLNGQDPVREEMVNRFEGIFVREFVLFEGDVLVCSMEEFAADTRVIATTPMSLTGRSCPQTQSRYGIISNLSGYLEAMTPKETEEEIDRYYQLDFLTRELFPLL